MVRRLGAPYVVPFTDAAPDDQAREAERLRLARELHDGSLQDLIGLSFRLAELERATPTTLEQALPELRQDVVTVIKQLRGLINDLRQGGLSEFGFAAALEAHLAKLERHHEDAFPEVRIELDEGLELLTDELILCLYRAAQEATSNAVKHARATRLRLKLSLNSREARLDICDDGLGFVLPERLSELTRLEHFGLAGIAERAALLGGALYIDTELRKGTKLTVTLPLGTCKGQL